MTQRFIVTCTFVVLVLAPSSVAAQWMPAPGAAPSSGPAQVLSVNPVGLMMEFYNAEYEMRVSDTLTAGAGASRMGGGVFGGEGRAYLNGDAFVRFYPSGRVFHGFALGLKVGGTQMHDGGTVAGLGFDINQSLIVNDHIVISSGFGLKRLLRQGSGFGPAMIPTLRLNVGIGLP